MRKLFLSMIAMLCLVGCAPVISSQSLNLVDHDISFANLRQDPDRYIGRHFFLAGEIAAIWNSNDGGEIEIIQFPADERGEVIDRDKPGGRFLAKSPDFIEPAVYRSGLLVTLVGKVIGKKTLPLDTIDYTYPVLAIDELYLWKPEGPRRSPAFNFGIGIGTILR